MSARFQRQIWHRVVGPNRLVMSPVSRLAPNRRESLLFLPYSAYSLLSRCSQVLPGTYHESWKHPITRYLVRLALPARAARTTAVWDVNARSKQRRDPRVLSLNSVFVLPSCCVEKTDGPRKK